MLLRSVLMAGLVALLTMGCAGKPRGPRFEMLAPPDATSTLVYIYRADTLRGVGPAPIKLDGEKLAELKNGEYLALVVDPGEHEVSAALMWFELFARSWNRMSLETKPGQTVYLKIWAATDALPPVPPSAQVPGRSDEKGDTALFMGVVDASTGQREIRTTRRANFR